MTKWELNLECKVDLLSKISEGVNVLPAMLAFHIGASLYFSCSSAFIFKFILFFYQKGIYTERRIYKEEDPPPTASLPK